MMITRKIRIITTIRKKILETITTAKIIAAIMIEEIAEILNDEMTGEMTGEIHDTMIATGAKMTVVGKEDQNQDLAQENEILEDLIEGKIDN